MNTPKQPTPRELSDYMRRRVRSRGGSAPPTIAQAAAYFGVARSTIRNRLRDVPTITRRPPTSQPAVEHAVLETYLNDHPKMKMVDVADHFGVTERTIYASLSRLRENLAATCEDPTSMGEPPAFRTGPHPAGQGWAILDRLEKPHFRGPTPSALVLLTLLANRAYVLGRRSTLAAAYEY